jgi:hypothetical protein
LTEAERLRLLAVFDEAVAAIPERPPAAIDQELADIRRQRHLGGRGRAGQ